MPREPGLMRSAPLLWLACSAMAWAGEAPIVLRGQAAYHGLTIPLPVLAQARHADLGDLRVLNARGEPVPHAWVDEAVPASVQEQQQALPFYKAPAAASAVTASQQGGWIVDARKVTGALLELSLSVPPGTHGVYDFLIETSDDLQRWQVHNGHAQLLSLQQQGLTLTHTSFELSGLRTRYLRLLPKAGSAPPPLNGVRVRSASQHQPMPPLQWSEPIRPASCTPQHCDYSLPRHLLLDRLEWQLADANTLASVELLVPHERSAPAPHSHRQRLRERLRELRQKDAPAAAPTWSLLVRTTAYWQRLPEGDVRSPPLRLDAGTATRLRVQPIGGMAQLGSKPPALRIGAPAVQLVFLAREPAPYRLVWGGEAAPALTLAQLMPTRKPGELLPVDTASVALPAAVVPEVRAAAAAPSAASAASAVPPASRKLWLWGALLAALAVMGVMAWSLLRPAKQG
jgi:hypothetical protein